MKRHLIFLYILAFGVLSYESSAEPYPFRPLAFTLDTTVTIDITVCFGEMYDGYTTSGTYRDTFDVDGMDSIRILHLTVLPEINYTISYTVCPGDSIMGYYAPLPNDYVYVDTFTAQNGCDSIRKVYIVALDDCTPYLEFDLDSCRSNMNEGTHMDYSEFEHTVLDSVFCGFPDLLCFSVKTAGFSRIPGLASKHSCTPGINFTPGMCMDASSMCTYQAAAPGALQLNFQAGPGVASQYVTGFEFYARAPIWYSWINGPSGVNNYPQYFGFRVLENNEEVYRVTDIPTTRQWQHYFFSLTRNGAPLLTMHKITIEFLPYCPLGVDADVSAWDIDEVILHHGYYFLERPAPVIQGYVRTDEGEALSGVDILVSETPDFLEPISVATDASGRYVINEPMSAGSYYLKASKTEEVITAISALDLVAIQKHLLGIAPFVEAVDLVRADIDRNEVINVLDVLGLQVFLLGSKGIYPGLSPWRIGVFEGALPHSYPEHWTEVIRVEYNGTDPLSLDLLAVRAGDCAR